MRTAPLTVRSVIDAVEASLREQILDQEIPMGATVRETDVAQAFAVARPTAKAAIERLVLAGLLRRDSHKSARVPSLSADDVADLYYTRMVLEAEIARRLARKGELPELAARSITDMKAVDRDAPPGHYVAPDIAFHTAMARDLGSQRINRIHAGLMQEMHLCMAQVQAHDLLSPQIIITEHERIAAAISNGDADEASQASQDHLDRACTALVHHLRTAPT